MRRARRRQPFELAAWNRILRSSRFERALQARVELLVRARARARNNAGKSSARAAAQGAPVRSRSAPAPAPATAVDGGGRADPAPRRAAPVGRGGGVPEQPIAGVHEVGELERLAVRAFAPARRPGRGSRAGAGSRRATVATRRLGWCAPPSMSSSCGYRRRRRRAASAGRRPTPAALPAGWVADTRLSTARTTTTMWSCVARGGSRPSRERRSRGAAAGGGAAAFDLQLSEAGSFHAWAGEAGAQRAAAGPRRPRTLPPTNPSARWSRTSCGETSSSACTLREAGQNISVENSQQTDCRRSLRRRHSHGTVAHVNLTHNAPRALLSVARGSCLGRPAYPVAGRAI